jgi:hypothetical protein
MPSTTHERNVMLRHLALSALVTLAAQESPQVRTVDLPIAGLLTAQDMSTPEAAFGAITKLLLEGGDWRPISISRFSKNEGFQKPSPPYPEHVAKRFREGRIVEVHQAGEKAAVIAALGGGGLDIRFLEREGGRWLNAGENMAPTLAGARTIVLKVLGVPPPKAAPIPNPEAHLARFVDYVKTAGRAPKAFLLETLATHRLTILGETHNRPLYWTFNGELVSDPAFAKQVGTICLELSASLQGHMDRFLASPALDAAPLLELFRDASPDGWPGQCTVDFLKAVWNANQKLPVARRIRVRCVDNPRDWAQVKSREDFSRTMANRDATMARNVLKDLEGDPRNALFIVGRFHTELDFHYQGRPNAGTLLRQRLKDQVYVVVQHGLVLEDNGRVHGRARGGLFDEAFQTLKDAPVAFPLARSPFAAEPYDGHPELEGLAKGTYGSCYDAYLYLGPLDKEILSPLIPGFYTDAYLAEVERRMQALTGLSLAKAYGLSSVDAKSLTQLREQVWGKPRWSRGLGPVDAWRK